MQPVAGADFAVVLAMADDGFDGVAAFLTFLLGRRDAAFLTGQDDLGAGVLNAVTAIPEVHIGFAGLYPSQLFDLLQTRRQRMAVIGPPVMRHGADDEVAFVGRGHARLAAKLVFLMRLAPAFAGAGSWRCIPLPAHARNKFCSGSSDRRP